MEFKEDMETIPWPTDMDGKKLDFGDVLFDTCLKQKFSIEHFEFQGGLLGPYWYASNGEGFCTRLSMCKKIEDDE